MWNRIALCLLVLAKLAHDQSARFTVAGQVIRPNGNPVRGAHVAILPSRSPDKQVATVTSENGAFGFSGVPAGKYALQVNYKGITRLYNQNEQFSTAVVVGPGLDSEHILFTLEPLGAIAGSVLDEGGDPVRNASVYLFTRSVDRGVARTRLKETTTTATDGSFHFTRLQKGTYYVAVAGRPWYAQYAMPSPRSVPLPAPDQVLTPESPPPPAELNVAYPVTYYGDVTSPEAASAIQVDFDARVEVHMNLHPVPALHLTLDGAENNDKQRSSVTLSVLGPGGTLLNVPTGSSGPNDLMGVAPGKYVITHHSRWNENQSTALGEQTLALNSDSTVHLNEGVKTSVKGKIVADGPLPERMAVLLESVENSNHASGLIQSDGSFIMPEVLPGRYDMRLANAPQLYMQSVVVKGAEYSKGALQISAGEQIEVTITTARGLTSIGGIAVKDGKPVAGAMVLAIPRDDRYGNYIPRDQSDTDGTFSLMFAPPGRYTVLAIEDGRGLEYANAKVIEPYLASGRVIDVPLPSETILNIEVQARK